MAVGSDEIGVIHPVLGFKLATTNVGIKQTHRPDLVLMELADGATCVGVFTLNAFCAPPVTLCKEVLQTHASRYLLVNTGNANAGTGAQGMADAKTYCAEIAALLDVPGAAVLPFSTGVIGEFLPLEKISSGFSELTAGLRPDNWHSAAHGIMTTDTRPKIASVKVSVGEFNFVVTGIAKGAGMLKPNMATMLSYVATDLTVDKTLLQQIQNTAMAKSFNRITVDGDTSTNDSAMLIATGASELPEVQTDGELYRLLQQAVTDVSQNLAQGLVRDAEGASKFVTVVVKNGHNSEECLQVAYTVAESPLVKTAFFASDANWGRLLMAVGRSGISDFNVGKVDLFLDDVCIASEGCVAAGYTEERGAAVMAKEEFTVTIDLSRGNCDETVWTSDLSHDYVRINAEYRT